ncbi:MAG: DUF1015 domain-containing protein [Candidatus Gastranaerophilales bacterium]|nr:DUF1015 domain-containing protein [Candidatus Gastranaerophilales bacterium]
MVEVKPLEAIVYNQEKVNMNDVIAPPYDVILDDYREELYQRSPYNIVKLILAKGSKDLSDPNNRYDEADKNFQKWLEEKVLIKLDKPCILYILQKYKTANGKQITRKGFIARNKIEDFSTKKILPHEFTMGGPKEDRLNLTKKCKANFSQIFMVYSDPQKQIENAVDLSQVPFIDVTDDNGVQNIVYKIEDEKTLALIEKVMVNKTLLIADGHHRYETALNYSKINTNPQTQYVMSYFTNLDDENLLVFPTHRIITKRIEPYVLLEKVKKYFDIEEFTFDGQNKNEIKAKFLQAIEESNKTQISMGLYMKNVNKFYLLTLKNDPSPLFSNFRKTAHVENSPLPQGARGEQQSINDILDKFEVPDVLKKLDLTVLHKVLITKEFGYTEEEQMSQDGIKYIKQESEAFDLVDIGKAQASFIMAYPKIKDIKEISEAGYRMPQKSTYFYPKLLSGIVINPLF